MPVENFLAHTRFSLLSKTFWPQKNPARVNGKLVPKTGVALMSEISSSLHLLSIFNVLRPMIPNTLPWNLMGIKIMEATPEFVKDCFNRIYRVYQKVN